LDIILIIPTECGLYDFVGSDPVSYQCLALFPPWFDYQNKSKQAPMVSKFQCCIVIVYRRYTARNGRTMTFLGTNMGGIDEYDDMELWQAGNMEEDMDNLEKAIMNNDMLSFFISDK
jgi:hypothetical protein